MAKAGAALAPRSGRTGVLFHGMSGAGKSACAIELSYQYEDLKRFTGFVWYQAPPEGSEVAGSLAAFATAFETQLSDESFEAPFPLVALVAAEDARFDAFLPRLRDFLTKRSVLLVLDNLETLLRPDGGWIDPRWGKVVATLLAHGGDSRVVLTSRVVPALAPPPGPPVAGDFAARLLKLPIHALGLDEAAVLARQLPNLGTLLKGRGGADDDTREVDRQLVVRTLNLVQGHPKLIELAEAQAADTQGLAGHLERAEGAWAAEGVGTGELASFFAAGESHVGADQFLRALAGWTDSVAATLPAAARTLFQVLCCCEDEDRQSQVIEANWSDIWKRLALPGDPPDLAATLAPLVQVGLVDERPAAPTGDATEAPTVRHFAIHPGVAEAGRAAAGEGIQAAVDVELAAFWRCAVSGRARAGIRGWWRPGHAGRPPRGSLPDAAAGVGARKRVAGAGPPARPIARDGRGRAAHARPDRGGDEGHGPGTGRCRGAGLGIPGRRPPGRGRSPVARGRGAGRGMRESPTGFGHGRIPDQPASRHWPGRGGARPRRNEERGHAPGGARALDAAPR